VQGRGNKPGTEKVGTGVDVCSVLPVRRLPLLSGSWLTLVIVQEVVVGVFKQYVILRRQHWVNTTGSKTSVCELHVNLHQQQLHLVRDVSLPSTFSLVYFLFYQLRILT